LKLLDKLSSGRVQGFESVPALFPRYLDDSPECAELLCTFLDTSKTPALTFNVPPFREAEAEKNKGLAVPSH